MAGLTWTFYATYLDDSSSAFANGFADQGYSFQSFTAAALFFGCTRSLMMLAFLALCVHYLYAWWAGNGDKDDRKEVFLYYATIIYAATAVVGATLVWISSIIIHLKCF